MTLPVCMAISPESQPTLFYGMMGRSPQRNSFKMLHHCEVQQSAAGHKCGGASIGAGHTSDWHVALSQLMSS